MGQFLTSGAHDEAGGNVSKLEALAESRRTTRRSSLHPSYPSSSNETGGSGSVPTEVSGTTNALPGSDTRT